MKPIPNTLEIGSYIHCGMCLSELPKGVSPQEYQKIQAGWTNLGLQIWCIRHDCNIIHIDFGGKKLKANTTRVSYPVRLTLSEFDNHHYWDDTEQFGLDDDREFKVIENEVITYAKKTGGQIYTQIDDGKGDRVYVRGLSPYGLGIWEVVKIKGLTPDNKRIEA